MLTDLIDIEWTDSKKNVSFREYTRYEFLPDQSNGTAQDVMVNVNPAYSGVVVTGLSDELVSLGFVGPCNIGNLVFMQTQVGACGALCFLLLRARCSCCCFPCLFVVVSCC